MVDQKYFLKKRNQLKVRISEVTTNWNHKVKTHCANRLNTGMQLTQFDSWTKHQLYQLYRS